MSDGVVQGGHDQGGVVLQGLVRPQLVVCLDVLEVLKHRLQTGRRLEESGRTERGTLGISKKDQRKTTNLYMSNITENLTLGKIAI